MNQPKLEYRASYLYIDGVKLARVCPVTGRLEFFDKDPHRSQQRGSRLVYMDVQTFVQQLLKILSTLQENSS
jgi:hypothetical protein